MRLFPRAQKPRQFVLFALIGACSFWLPDVAVHAFTRFDFQAKHLWLVTAISPAALLLTYLLLLKPARRANFRQLGVAMMVGLWLLGGIFMMGSASFSGGGFASFHLGTLLWALLSIVPVMTCMMAIYDGSLFALAIVTIGALCVLCVRIWDSQGAMTAETKLDERT